MVSASVLQESLAKIATIKSTVQFPSKVGTPKLKTSIFLVVLRNAFLPGDFGGRKTGMIIKVAKKLKDTRGQSPQVKKTNLAIFCVRSRILVVISMLN